MRAIVLASLIGLALVGCGGGAATPTPPEAQTPVAPRALGHPATMSASDVLAALRSTIGTTPAVSASPPTITPGAAGAVTTIAGSVLVPWASGHFTYTGNMVAAAGASDLGINQAVSYSATFAESNYLAIDFLTDAPSLEIYVEGAVYKSRMRFVVDGELAAVTPVEYPGGDRYLTRLDFPNRVMRRVRIQGNNPGFGGVRVSPGDIVQKVPAPSFRAMFIGDSITEGPADVAADTSYTYAPLAAEQLGWSDAWISGVGATGYLQAPAPKLNFRQRFDQDVKAFAPNVLVIAGGINDSSFTAGQLETEARTIFDRIQNEMPETLVFVLGPWNPRQAIPAWVNTSIKTAAAGRPNFYWVPNYDDAWITGTGKVDAPAGDGNSDWVIAAGGTHPTVAGHAYLAGKLAAAIRTLIQ